MSRGKRYLVVSYYAFHDPLFQGLLWRIINRLKSPDDQIVLITLEHDKIDQSVRLSLEKEGVHWKPIAFEYGNSIQWRKLAMMMRIQWLLWTSAISHSPFYIFTSGSLAASLCWPLTALLRLKQVVYAFEPHSEFLREQKKIEASSLSYKVLRFFETRVIKGRSVLMTGTHAMRDQILAICPTAQVFLLPTNADEELFQFSEKNRMVVRDRLGVVHRKVITYVGKFGDLYLGKELVVFFAEMWRQNNALFFMILTPNDKAEIARWFEEEGVDSNHFCIGSCALTELPDYLSAADFGVVAYADFPSRKYTSPTKSGNYLLCGLPYIIQRGTSDDDRVVAAKKVGVVIDCFDTKNAHRALQQMQEMWELDIIQLRQECRLAGIEYRGMQNADRLYAGFFKS